MYSMKRTMCGVERNRCARSITAFSFMPRFTTASILIGCNPAASAASMASSTRATGKSASFIARNVASSSESRLIVTRSSPADFSARAFASVSSDPFVVNVKSRMPAIDRSSATSRSRSRRKSGSPPVRRIFSTPLCTNARATRASSSYVSSSSRRRNWKSFPNTSFGMQ